MTWFKVDDSFYDHPKVFDLPDSAVALWTRAGSWSARNLKDGFVPHGMPRRLCDDPETAIRELIEHGLWRIAKGGYQFHDWSDYQPTREEANAAKAAKSAGGKIGNHRRWHAARGVIDPACRYCPASPPPSDRGGYRSGTDAVSDRLSDKSQNDVTASAYPPTDVASRISRAGQDRFSSDNASDNRSDTDHYSESLRNPPVPTRPDQKNGTALSAGHAGGQSVRAQAGASEARRHLTARYGLTDDEAARVITEVQNRAREPIKHLAKYLMSMAEGDLADIAAAVMLPAPPPPPPTLTVVPESAPQPRTGDTQPPLLTVASEPLYDLHSGEEHRTAAPLLNQLRNRRHAATGDQP